MIKIRRLELPGDYEDMARLMNTLRAEPITADELQEEDKRVPAANFLSFDEAGLLTGFGRERVAAVDELGETVGYAAAWRAPWAVPGRLGSQLIVAPSHQGRGIGKALAEHLESWAREQGAASLWAEAPDHLLASRAFFEKRGYAIDGHMFQSTLDLSAFDGTLFAGVVEAVQDGGIRFCTLAEWDGQRDELHQLFLKTYMDNPAATELPPEDEVREHFEQADPALLWLAVEGGRLVGMTELIAMGQTGGLFHEYTGVDPACRGRKIALALKLLSIRHALALGAPYMRTDNDAKNLPMLAVNRKLGYLPVPGHYRVWKTL